MRWCLVCETPNWSQCVCKIWKKESSNFCRSIPFQKPERFFGLSCFGLLWNFEGLGEVSSPAPGTGADRCPFAAPAGAPGPARRVWKGADLMGMQFIPFREFKKNAKYCRRLLSQKKHGSGSTEIPERISAGRKETLDELYAAKKTLVYGWHDHQFHTTLCLASQRPRNQSVFWKIPLQI